MPVAPLEGNVSFTTLEKEFMKKWWIGCSGFYYKHWRERFYPRGLPMNKWFEFYCEHFNTVELNVTFYRFPTIEMLDGWYQRSPADFRFTVKAPRLITHYRKFKDAGRETSDFYEIVRRGLREKLGTVLFQFHPKYVYSEENFDRVLTVLDPSFTNALEFRHESWWRDDVVKILRRNHLTFCSISYPGLPDDVFKANDVVYYRFHGVPDLYRSAYSIDKLEAIANSIRAFRGVQDIYAYFNNDIDVAAIDNALQLQQLVGTVINPSVASSR